MSIQNASQSFSGAQAQEESICTCNRARGRRQSDAAVIPSANMVTLSVQLSESLLFLMDISKSTEQNYIEIWCKAKPSANF